MVDLPRLRPRQWALLTRFVAIQERLDAQHSDEPIAVAFTNGGTVIARPGVADAEIDAADFLALRALGSFDELSWNDKLARFRVSQTAYDLVASYDRVAGEPTADERLERYRQRRMALASRIARIVGWAVFGIGVAVVIFSAAIGSWVFAVVGVITAVFGTVAGLAELVTRRVASRIDSWLVDFFEVGTGSGGDR